jgi:hypothetical protein
MSPATLPGTLRKNVALVQKSCKTSVEQSFFAGVPATESRLHRSSLAQYVEGIRRIPSRIYPSQRHLLNGRFYVVTIINAFRSVVLTLWRVHLVFSLPYSNYAFVCLRALSRRASKQSFVIVLRTLNSQYCSELRTVDLMANGSFQSIKSQSEAL